VKASRAVLLVSLLAACPGARRAKPDSIAANTLDADDGTPHAGTRLKPYYWTDGHGLKIFGGWFDTKLQSRCAFSECKGETCYCAPPSMRYKQLGQLPCGSTPSSPPVPFEELVSRGPPTHSGPGRIVPQVYVASDGARETTGVFDQQRGEHCVVRRAGDGRMRCLPGSPHGMVASYFADATCTKPLLFTRGQRSGDVQFAWATPLPDTDRLRLFRFGAPIKPSQVWSFNSFGCQKSGTNPNEEYFEAGEEIDPREFAPVTMEVSGTGRIREQIVRSDDGRVLVRGFGWYDSQLDTNVDVQLLDEQRRVLLPPTAWTDGYADEKCKTRAVRAYNGWLPRIDFAMDMYVGCKVSHIYRLGPLIRTQYQLAASGPSLDPSQSQECNARGPDRSLHAVADEVDVRTFVILEPVH